MIEHYQQCLRILVRYKSELKEVQVEIRSKNETLVTLATKLRHYN